MPTRFSMPKQETKKQEKKYLILWKNYFYFFRVIIS